LSIDGFVKDFPAQNATGDDNLGLGIFETGKFFHKFNQIRNEESFLGPENQNMASSMRDFNGGAANAQPFDAQLTQILPDPSLQTQRLDANLSMSILNIYESNREEVRHDSHIGPKVNGTDPYRFPTSQIRTELEAKLARTQGSIPNVSRNTHEEVIVGGFDIHTKLSWLKKARLCNRLFKRLQIQKLWGAFCRMVAKCRVSKTALTGVSDRMVAKLLLSTRQAICGGDVKKSFRKWHMVANPEFSRDCIVKFLSRLPIRFQYVVYRMRALVHKRRNTVAPVQKVLNNGRGLSKVVDQFSKNIRGKLEVGWSALTRDGEERKKRVERLAVIMTGRHQKLVKKYLDNLRELSGGARRALEKLIKAVQQKERTVLNHLVTQQKNLKVAKRTLTVGSLAVSERVKSISHLQAAWEAVKAEAASNKRIEAVRRRVVIRLVYLSGAQLHNSLMTLKLHNLERNNAVYNQKSDLLSKMGARFQANLKSDKGKALNLLRKFKEKAEAEEHVRTKIFEGKAWKHLSQFHTTCGLKVRNALVILMGHARLLKDRESTDTLRRRAVVSQLVTRVGQKPRECLHELRSFARERILIFKAGLLGVDQVMRTLRDQNNSHIFLRLALHSQRLRQFSQGFLSKLSSD
jgi:hypothetical protein